MHPVEINDANFAEFEAESKPVLVDCWAEWCGPCRMLTPIIEELANSYEGKAVIGKLDVDSNPNTSIKFGIRSIPTVLLLKGGKVVDKHVGLAPKDVFERMLAKHL